MPFAGDYQPPASPGENQPFSMDFGPQLVNGDTLNGSVVAALEAYEGTDANAAGALKGAPTVAGSIITQWIGGAQPGGLQPCVVYRLTFTAVTAQGKTLINYAHLACKPIE